MKKIILILGILLSAFTTKAQVINVCGTDSVTLTVDNYVNGTIEWQESIDTLSWANIPEVSGITYRFLPTQTKYYRAVVKTTDCQPLYSAISLVQLIPIANAGTDRIIGNTSMTLLGNSVPEATGEWTILSGSGGVLDNSTNPKALLTGVNKEKYSLKWTLTNACGQSSDTINVTFDDIISKNNFIVVDNTDAILSDSTQMANGIYKIKFSDATINPTDSVMLIGMRKDISFLRKVITFTLQDSTYIFNTVQGTFEELIKTGVLNMGDAVNQAMLLDSPKRIKSNSTLLKAINTFPTRETLRENSNNKGIKLLYAHNIDEDKYPKVKAQFNNSNGEGLIIPLPEISVFKIEGTFNTSITNSFVRINPNFVLDYTYSFPARLTKLNFGVDNAELEYNINSKLEVTAPIISDKQEKSIVELTKYIVFMAGPIPVVCTANFDIKASIALNASAGISIEQKKNYKMNITALVSGESVDNLILTKKSTETSTHEEKFSGIAKTSFEFNIGPEVSFKAYDFIGPYFKVPAKFKLSLCANSNSNWSGEAAIGYECKLGANAKVLGLTLFDFNYKFLKDEIMGKIKLPYQLELLSGNFQKGVSGKMLTNPITLRATSHFGFGIPLVPVRFDLESDNGSVDQKVKFTDIEGKVSVNWTLGSNPQNTLKVSVLDCDDKDIENSPTYVYARSSPEAYDCTNSSLSINMKTANGFISPSVTGGIAPYTYSTNGVDYSSTKPQFNILVPKKDTVFVKDKNQCVRSRTFEVKPIDACANSNLTLDVLIQPNILNITGKGGKTPYQFAIDNTSFTPQSSFYKLAIGKHTVYIKDANGCMASNDITIDNDVVKAAIRSAYPAQNATSIPVNGITFQWVAANYAANQVYDIYLKKGNDSYSLIASDISTASYTYNTALDNSSNYTWKLAVKSATNVMDYAEFSFTTASGVATTPTAPILTLPANGGIVDLSTTLKWTPQGGDFKYDIYLDDANATRLVANNLTTNEYSINGLTSGKKYFWKVKIKNMITGEYRESAVWNFTPSQPSDAFITKWNLPAGSFTLPLAATGTYNCTVDWGDGTSSQITNYMDSQKYHVYSTPDVYSISITGIFSKIGFRGYDLYGDQPNKMLIEVSNWGNVGFTDLSYAFYNCPFLSKLPEGPITGATTVTTFDECFGRCTSLTTIPATLFSTTPNVTSFATCFGGCTGLTTIPAELFSSNPNVIFFTNCFVKCLNLTSIPEDLFSSNLTVTSFAACFGACTGLTVIPARLFSRNLNVTDFTFCFQVCRGLKSIPENLFDGNPSVISFEGCFQECNNLSGNAPQLWLRSNPSLRGEKCFSNCSALSNYTTIPDSWK